MSLSVLQKSYTFIKHMWKASLLALAEKKARCILSMPKKVECELLLLT